MKSTEDKSYYKRLRSSILFFIEETWKLKPQPVKPEYLTKLKELIDTTTHKEWEEKKKQVTAEWFGTFNNDSRQWEWIAFEKGKHISWQQYLILIGIEKAVQGKAKRSISVASGRGIGKSATLSWIMLWFLFCFPDCQIPCTAPTSDQMFDVLWKEVALWIHRMPEGVRSFYDWESSHVRITESPYTWFARAKTASKENPEALSGVHADFVLALVDEASAIDEPIFTAAQGIFSSPDAYFMMISNPTRLNGFFRDSHTKDRDNWQTFQFSSEDSPLVHKDLLDKYGKDGTTSDEYRVNVLGLFPNEDALDSKSYVQLVSEQDIRFIPVSAFKPIAALSQGVDPAGEGDNETAYALRDRFMGYIVAKEQTSSATTTARTLMTICDKWKVSPRNTIVDSFGVGADVAKEVALASRWNIRTANVGELCERERDRNFFTNKRAEMYWKMKLWLENGGMLVENKKLKEEILSIRFRRNTKGKIEIMPKRDMRKLGLASPDEADALALTFLFEPQDQEYIAEEEKKRESEFNPYDVF